MRLVLLLITLILGSCSRSLPPAAKAAGDVSAEASSGRQADSIGLPQRLAGGVLSGLPLGRVLPEDVEIGTLQDGFASGDREGGAARVARGFLAALVDGRVAEDLCSADDVDFLRRNLEAWTRADRRLRSWRLGSVTVYDGDPLRAEAKLLAFDTEDTASRAVIYLTRITGEGRPAEWKITGFVADTVGVPSTQRPRFEPWNS